MNPFQKNEKSIINQSQIVKSAFNRPFQNITEIIKNQNQLNLNLYELSGISNFSKILSQHMKIHNSTSIFTGKIPKIQIPIIQIPKSDYALKSINFNFSKIINTNQLISNNISNFASSQLLITNKLAEFGKLINPSHINQFNSISVALQGISNSYIKNIDWKNNWRDFEIVEETNETITNIADEIINNSSIVTKNELEVFKASLINELFKLLEKTQSIKARQFIFEVISVIGFLLTFYQSYQSNKDNSNKEVIIEVKKEIKKHYTDIPRQIEKALNRLNQTRIARTNVNLRTFPKKNSKIIDIVKVGQRVSVIEIRHKYLLIAYIDKNDNKPKSGFVIKKYFKIEK